MTYIWGSRKRDEEPIRLPPGLHAPVVASPRKAWERFKKREAGKMDMAGQV